MCCFTFIGTKGKRLSQHWMLIFATIKICLNLLSSMSKGIYWKVLMHIAAKNVIKRQVLGWSLNLILEFVFSIFFNTLNRANECLLWLGFHHMHFIVLFFIMIIIISFFIVCISLAGWHSKKTCYTKTPQDISNTVEEVWLWLGKVSFSFSKFRFSQFYL